MNKQATKLMIIAGARPNFMKIAPFMKAITAWNSSSVNEENKIQCKLVHTGQHYDDKMSDVFFRELGIPAPDINLNVGSDTHAVQTANVMIQFEPVCLEYEPDWVIVVGDVNSSLACTLVAVKCGIRVAHIEAGLRSFDRDMPEEINRLVTDVLADLLLTPSADADENLRNEGISEEKVRLVGNIMIDSLLDNLPKSRQSNILNKLNISKNQFAFVTLHRPSNVDNSQSLSTIMKELRLLSNRLPIIFPIHPRTRSMLSTFGIDDTSSSEFQLIEPIGYYDCLSLAENARIVLTDSGGLQEETTYFKTPCLTLRPNTERPVTITIGSNKLTNVTQLKTDLEEVLAGENKKCKIPPLWDGKTAERCLDAILEFKK